MRADENDEQTLDRSSGTSSAICFDTNNISTDDNRNKDEDDRMQEILKEEIRLM